MVRFRSWIAITAVIAILFFWTRPAFAVDLVMFDAPWCGYCRAFKADVLPWYSSTAVGRVVPLHVVSSQEPAWFNLQEPIRGLPTFVLVDGGREVGRFSGYSSSRVFFDTLNAKLRDYLTRALAR